VDALELKNRVRGDKPLVVVATRRTSPGSRQTVRTWDGVAQTHGVEALAIDADERDHEALLDALGVQVVPSSLIFARSVLLERRADVVDSAAAATLLREALARAPRPA
jgi:hypothetical protein